MNILIMIAVFLFGFAGIANAQILPIFIKQNKQAPLTYTKKSPTIVGSLLKADINKSRTYTGPGRKSSQITEKKNLFEGTSFGRIKTEQKFFDKETNRYHNQYDYMGLLALRSNDKVLNHITKLLQTKGVFDPKKYKESIAAAKAGRIGRSARRSNTSSASYTSPSSDTSPSSGASPSSDTSPSSSTSSGSDASRTSNTAGATAQPTTVGGAADTKRVFVIKDDKNDTLPWLIHNQYDAGGASQSPEPTKKTNAPIFLR